MKYKKINEYGGVRNYLLVFDTGDDFTAGLLDFAGEQSVLFASFSAVGAFERSTIAFFDLAKKDYEKTLIDEQVEVMSLVGNIAFYEHKPKVHAHVIIGKRGGSAHGGHLMSGTVRPTLEVSLSAFDTPIVRTLDDTTNLPLIDLDAS